MVTVTPPPLTVLPVLRLISGETSTRCTSSAAWFVGVGETYRFEYGASASPDGSFVVLRTRGRRAFNVPPSRLGPVSWVTTVAVDTWPVSSVGVFAAEP